MKSFIVLAFLFLLSILMRGQNRQLLYDFDEIPQSLMVNPGADTKHKWHVGVPVISGIMVQGATSGVTVNDIFADDGVDINLKVRERMLNGMNARDDFSITSQIEGFYVGFQGRNRPENYYSFGMYGETDIIVYWPEDLARLAFDGNGGPNIGRQFDLGDLNLRGEMTNVFHFGIRKKVKDNLTLGFRAKLYSNIFNFKSTNNSGTFLTTEGEDNILSNSISADLGLQTAGLNEIRDILREDSDTTQDDLTSLFTNRVLLGGNLGLGLDLGFTYEWSEQTQISGSVLDLGFIYNSKDVLSYTLEGSAVNEGINVLLPEDINTIGEDRWQELIDEIEAALPFEENEDNYIMLRPVKLYGSITHDWGEDASGTRRENCGCAINVRGGSSEQYYRNRVGGLLYMIKRPLGVQAALTGSYQRRFGRNFSVKTSYTIDKYSFSNVGLGLALKAGPVQFYILGDNLLSYQNIADSNYASLQFGFNILSWNDN
ncbi:MAG: DUF5723 family protein [Bacteroidota bacterium]